MPELGGCTIPSSGCWWVDWRSLGTRHSANLENSRVSEACADCQGASLVAQWLRVCLPMQGTRVRSLVGEDPTCSGATKPVSHSY
ncbi:hypothetical protein J1605_012439 [Eschrichtius robustus]|uniref:Uncharacterized protein n=1 Tax=Eschrichtius robustus TaxID=9764 RepID=A0AB34GLC7_ESCRO|nr:hypothetical protein J1605_012439 [Eschrichtius robustus]